MPVAYWLAVTVPADSPLSRISIEPVALRMIVTVEPSIVTPPPEAVAEEQPARTATAASEANPSLSFHVLMSS